MRIGVRTRHIPIGHLAMCGLLYEATLGFSPLSPELRETGLEARGKRRKETPNPLVLTKPRTPGPSPLSTRESGGVL